MKHILSITFSLALFFVVLFSCKKDKPLLPENIDPCSCAKEVTAEFDIIEILSFLTSFPEHENITDHILENKNVRFRAHFEGADSYTWYLGTEELHTREVVRYFSETWVNQDIQVTLVVNSAPNTLCFPNDDGHDSITKTFHIYPECDSTLMEGWFRVALEGTTDSVDIGIDTHGAYPLTGSQCTYITFYNYNMQGDTLIHYPAGNKVFTNYRWMQLQGKTTITPYNSFFFTAIIDMNNVYHIKMARGNPQFNPYNDEFPEKYTGRKL